jgi:uncharacterized membrane protein
MKRTTATQLIDHERDLEFERGRLLNLIDSRIRRREMDAAKELAEELFSTEIEFALLEKAKKLRRYNSVLSKIMQSLITILLISITCMVVNIHPSFNLLAEVVTILALISAVVINSLLVKRFGRAIKMMVEVYETVKQSFIDRLIDSFIHHNSPHKTLKMFSVTVVK